MLGWGRTLQEMVLGKGGMPQEKIWEDSLLRFLGMVLWSKFLCFDSLAA